MKVLPNLFYKMFAKQIIKENFNVAPTKTTFIARGCYGIVYEVHLPIAPYMVIVKIYLTDNMCKDEAVAIEMLSKYSAVPMPHIYSIVIKNHSHRNDALIMQKLNGTTLNALRNVPVEHKKIIAENIISALLDLNKIKGDYYGEIAGDKQYTTWKEYYQTVIDNVMAGLQERVNLGKYSADLYDKLTLISKEFDGLIESDVIQPHLIHGDFKPKNVLIDGLAVSGIIDPCGGCFGDLAYEARQLTKNNGVDFDLLQIYKNKTNNNTASFEKRRLFYMIFSDIYHMLKSDIYFIDGTCEAIKCYESIKLV